MQIRFSTKSFGVDAAEVAARAIENIAGTLVDADMSDIIAGRPGACLVLILLLAVRCGLLVALASLRAAPVGASICEQPAAACL